MVDTLFPAAGMQAADTVTFSFRKADELEALVTTRGEAVSLSLSGRSGQFACESGSLVVRNPAQWVRGFGSPPGGPGPVPFVGGDSVSLKLELVDGYLIITRRDVDFMWLPFPARTKWSSWYRFQRVTP